ncbi:MAG TPA: lysophospholipid acyltransferase family protein [Verrucomicrobiota bacterium]|nr:lysophospholipid acyltransferase family protein [Verrucomicrobiota bacterium]
MAETLCITESVAPPADAPWRQAQKTVATPGAILRGQVPRISRPLLRWFTWYSRRYIRNHFHSLRVSRAGLPLRADRLPLVIYSNHASWWDALVGLVLKVEFFPDRAAFAPMDAAMLERYRFFRRLGFFGVEQRTRRSAVQFLRTAEAVLESPQGALFITPQSRFADVRERPLRFESGLGHLAARVRRALFVPAAIEYVFWEERLPEILVRFGEPVEIPAGNDPQAGRVAPRVPPGQADEAGATARPATPQNSRAPLKGPALLPLPCPLPMGDGRGERKSHSDDVRPVSSRSHRHWTSLFEQKLADAQDALALEAQRRQPEDFETVLRGGAGQGGVYDWWRSLKAAYRGEKFRKEHGAK